MAHLSLWLTVCGIVLLCVAVPHASCHPSPVDSRHEIMPYYQQAEQPEQYRHSDDNDVENEDDAANEKINLQEFEPVLKDSGSKDRTGRKLDRLSVPRTSRFKEGNPNLVKRMQAQEDYENGFHKRVIFVKDDKDPPINFPDPSSLPWLQLAMLGIMIWGLNVVFTQMILNVTETPYVPLPFGLNRSAKEMSDAEKAPNSSRPFGSVKRATEGLDFTEAPKILSSDDSNKSSFNGAPNSEISLNLTHRAKQVLDVTKEMNLPSQSAHDRRSRNAPEQLPSWERSLDFFEDNDTLGIPAEERCKEQMICEMSYLMTYVDSLEKIVRTYGMHFPGLRPGYQKAISDGSSRRPCKTPQKEECPNSVLTLLLSVAKAITGEHY